MGWVERQNCNRESVFVCFLLVSKLYISNGFVVRPFRRQCCTLVLQSKSGVSGRMMVVVLVVWRNMCVYIRVEN